MLPIRISKRLERPLYREQLVKDDFVDFIPHVALILVVGLNFYSTRRPRERGVGQKGCHAFWLIVKLNVQRVTSISWTCGRQDLTIFVVI